MSRAERIYDWWGRHPKLYKTTSVQSPAVRRERAFSRLDLSEGERVLEMGCGPGVNFGPLRNAVGPTGTVVGLDFSAEMVQQATRRVRDHDWSNVHAVRGDATHAGFTTDSFDAAIAPLALSTMPNVQRALENIQDTLRPNGRLVVVELDVFQEGPLKLLNPLYRRFMKYVFGRQLDTDVLTELRTVFETVDVETFDYGSSWVALAE